jgi:thiol-disulfide isomerase/thioredoxin
MSTAPAQPSPSSTRKWLVVGLAVVIAWSIFASSARRVLKVGELSPPDLATLAVPRPVDFRWSLLDLDGKPVDFASFQGRPILLNLWATWCPPCLEEMPAIANLAASEGLKGRDVAIICVSTDESAESLRQFMKDKEWKATVLRATALPPCFQTEGIPATFLINRGGRIVSAQLGPAQWDDPSVIAFLQKMAAK